MATKTAAPLRPTDPLPVNTRVILTEDIVGIPGGTTGKVVFVEGLSWIRYWVHFDTGERRGQIARAKLMTPDEWDRKASGGGPAATAVASVEGSGAAATGGGSSNAFGVPDLLIERSKDARARWAAKQAG